MRQGSSVPFVWTKYDDLEAEYIALVEEHYHKSGAAHRDEERREAMRREKGTYGKRRTCDMKKRSQAAERRNVLATILAYHKFCCENPRYHHTMANQLRILDCTMSTGSKCWPRAGRTGFRRSMIFGALCGTAGMIWSMI